MNATFPQNLDRLSETLDGIERMTAFFMADSVNRPIFSHAIPASVREDNFHFNFTPDPDKAIRFDDIIGLDEIKRRLRDEIILPALHPEQYPDLNIPTGGALLYGLPGNGKTMLLRAVAAETDANICIVNPCDLFGRRMGDSSIRIRKLFDTARSIGNAIICFDGFEACFHERNTANLPDELCRLMEDVKANRGRLVVLAATHRPWEVDHRLFGPSVFAHRLYVPLPDASSRRKQIMRYLNAVPKQGEIDVESMVLTSEGFNSADIRALCNRASWGPVRRAMESGNHDQYVTPEDIQNAIHSIKTSILPEEQEQMKAWHDSFSKY